MGLVMGICELERNEFEVKRGIRSEKWTFNHGDVCSHDMFFTFAESILSSIFSITSHSIYCEKT